MSAEANSSKPESQSTPLTAAGAGGATASAPPVETGSGKEDRPWYGLDDSNFNKSTLGTWTNARGVELVTSSWSPPDGSLPKGVVILCHGYGHFIAYDEQYDLIGDRLSRAGFAVHGLDQSNFGSSPGLRALVDDFDHLVQDQLGYRRSLEAKYAKLLDDARAARATAEEEAKTKEGSVAEEPVVVGESKDGEVAGEAEEEAQAPIPAHMPFFLLGESMGGAVAINTAHDGSERFEGAVLMAPMAGIEKKLMPPACVVKTLICMSKCCPTAPLVPGPDILPLSFKDKAKLERVRHDPRAYHGKARLKTGVSMLHASNAVRAAIPEYKFPFFLLHGTADEVTKLDSSKAVYEGCASTDKTLFMYEGCFHALMWEPEVARDLILTDIVNWLRRRAQAAAAGETITGAQAVTRSEAFLRGEAAEEMPSEARAGGGGGSAAPAASAAAAAIASEVVAESSSDSKATSDVPAADRV